MKQRKKTRGRLSLSPEKMKGSRRKVLRGRLATHSVFQDDISGSYGTSAPVDCRAHLISGWTGLRTASPRPATVDSESVILAYRDMEMLRRWHTSGGADE